MHKPRQLVINAKEGPSMQECLASTCHNAASPIAPSPLPLCPSGHELLTCLDGAREDLSSGARTWAITLTGLWSPQHPLNCPPLPGDPGGQEESEISHPVPGLWDITFKEVLISVCLCSIKQTPALSPRAGVLN